MRAALTETYLRLASERGDAALTKDERLLALSALFNFSPSADSADLNPFIAADMAKEALKGAAKAKE
jgi:hypothetical protein